MNLTVITLLLAPPNVKIGSQTENGTEPSAPITKKGILTSFKTGKPMNIPDSDVVLKTSLILDTC